MLIRIKSDNGGTVPLIDCDRFEPIKMPDGNLQAMFYKLGKEVYKTIISSDREVNFYIMEGGKTSQVIEWPSPAKPTCTTQQDET